MQVAGACFVRGGAESGRNAAAPATTSSSIDHLEHCARFQLGGRQEHQSATSTTASIATRVSAPTYFELSWKCVKRPRVLGITT